MPDISLCISTICPSKEKCYRATAIPSIWQSYMQFEVPKGKKKCSHFMKIIKDK